MNTDPAQHRDTANYGARIGEIRGEYENLEPAWRSHVLWKKIGDLLAALDDEHAHRSAAEEMQKDGEQLERDLTVARSRIAEIAAEQAGAEQVHHRLYLATVFVRHLCHQAADAGRDTLPVDLVGRALDGDVTALREHEDRGPRPRPCQDRHVLDGPEPDITASTCPPHGVEQPPELLAALADLAQKAASTMTGDREPCDELRAAANTLRAHPTVTRWYQHTADLLDHLADDMQDDGARTFVAGNGATYVHPTDVGRTGATRYDWSAALWAARAINEATP